uniref:Fibrinogen C-terminal domain-containing protein n=1 Tax=Clytia hemisphaerica TaxID=252671 RepID=A0A7M5X5M5_9CNID
NSFTRRMEIFVLIFYLQYLVCIGATSSASSKSVGNLLDHSLANLKQSVEALKQSNRKLTADYQTLKNQVAFLKKLHPKCGPCRSFGDNKYCDCTEIQPRQNCLEFYQAGYKISGIYRLHGSRFGVLNVFCDQTTDNGGWITFLRRTDGSVDFTRNWNDYKLGFGKLTGEFWFGNENVHDLTKPEVAPKKSELLINMIMVGQTKMVYAKYDIFEVGDEASKYVLTITGASGNVTTNRFDYHNGKKFSTLDADNDRWTPNSSSEDGSCAKAYGKGWWYGHCYYTLLTGEYKFTKGKTIDGEITWDDQQIDMDPVFVEMKFRRKL